MHTSNGTTEYEPVKILGQWYVERYDLETGKVRDQYGPLPSERAAEKCAERRRSGEETD